MAVRAACFPNRVRIAKGTHLEQGGSPEDQAVTDPAYFTFLPLATTKVPVAIIAS